MAGGFAAGDLPAGCRDAHPEGVIRCALVCPKEAEALETEAKLFEDLEFQQLERESRLEEEREARGQQLLQSRAECHRSIARRKVGGRGAPGPAWPGCALQVQLSPTARWRPAHPRCPLPRSGWLPWMLRLPRSGCRAPRRPSAWPGRGTASCSSYRR